MIVMWVVVAIIVLMLITALFTKKEYVIKREIIINRSQHDVYEYLRFFKNHRSFNAWLLKDPAMKETSRGTDGQVGYVLSYEGNKDVGTGEEELVGLVPDKRIDIELRFLKPFKSTSRTPFDLEPAGNNQTKVTWTMHGKMNYPANIALLFINMDNFLGKDVSKSLENLKVILEK